MRLKDRTGDEQGKSTRYLYTRQWYTGLSAII